MKLNTKGAMDMMLVAALAVVLVVGGFVLMRINESDDTIANSDSAEVSDSEQEELNTDVDMTIPDDWVEYKDELSGLSFYHPPELSPDAQGGLTEESIPGKGIRRSIAIVGYESDDNQGIHINIEPISEDTRSIEFLLSETLDETSEVKKVTISGFDGVRYNWQPEVVEEASLFPDPHKAAEFDSEMYRISIIQGYNYGEADTLYATEFERIISTIKAN